MRIDETQKEDVDYQKYFEKRRRGRSGVDSNRDRDLQKKIFKEHADQQESFD